MSGSSRADLGRGKRATRQRAAIARFLDESGRFMSAQEIHSLLVDGGSNLGLATVYRNLQMLAASGDVDVLQREGEILYRRCGSEDHHHHLVCRSCRRSVEVESKEIEEWAVRVASRHGFSSPSHTVEVFGLCDNCRPNPDF
ncbi:MAG: transcriptional repressor [Actinomycetota bacterium]|nr:transcriptional repressor [Actinomycetota bacterium]